MATVAYSCMTGIRKSLPKWARSLAPEAQTLLQLKTAIRFELREAEAGNNPLTDKQYRELSTWLAAA